METNLHIENQYNIEEHFNERLVKNKIRTFLEEEGKEQIEQGVELLEAYIHGEYFESKNARLEQLKLLDTRELVVDVFETTAFILNPTLITGVCAKIASRLGFDEKVPAITTAAEILAVLAEVDLYDIYKVSKYGSTMVMSKIELPEALEQDVTQCEYLPPMVCEPLELTNNRSSGYLTQKGVSLILGGAVNHHSGDICLDVLNTMNKVPLTLNTDFLSFAEEDPSEITVESIKDKAAKNGKFLNDVQASVRVQAALANWDNFKEVSYKMYALMVANGNRFYLNHRVDKRGRIYSQGYHITTQGAPFKKAMIDLADQETIEVPDEFKL